LVCSRWFRSGGLLRILQTRRLSHLIWNILLYTIITRKNKFYIVNLYTSASNVICSIMHGNNSILPWKPCIIFFKKLNECKIYYCISTLFWNNIIIGCTACIITEVLDVL
jgi:hypothetical protein